jgi:hypothetical protein
MRAWESAIAGTTIKSAKTEKANGRRKDQKRDEHSAGLDITGSRNFLYILDHELNRVVARLFGSCGSNWLPRPAQDGLGVLLGDVQNGTIRGQTLEYRSNRLSFLQMAVILQVVEIPEVLIERQLVETAVKLQFASALDSCRDTLENRSKFLN